MLAYAQQQAMPVIGLARDTTLKMNENFFAAATAAMRFCSEYMGMGVALKPLGERWFTARFRGVMDAFDSDPLQKPTEGNPIVPWKNWDSSWRNKLKTDVMQASSDRALVVVTFATDESGRPIARLVHLGNMGVAWRVDNVTDAPRKDQ
jgi:hypothetical protein